MSLSSISSIASVQPSQAVRVRNDGDADDGAAAVGANKAAVATNDQGDGAAGLATAATRSATAVQAALTDLKPGG